VAYVVSDLIPTRIPYQTECLVEDGARRVSLQTADICTAGILLEGQPSFEKAQDMRLRLLGEDAACWLEGRVAYAHASTVGVDLKLMPEEQSLLGSIITLLFFNKPLDIII